MITLLRRPPFLGRSTASAVFFGPSCILSLVNVKFALPSLSLRSKERRVRISTFSESFRSHIRLALRSCLQESVECRFPYHSSYMAHRGADFLRECILFSLRIVVNPSTIPEFVMSASGHFFSAAFFNLRRRFKLCGSRGDDARQYLSLRDCRCR